MSATGSPRASSQTDDFMERVLCKCVSFQKGLKRACSSRIGVNDTALQGEKKQLLGDSQGTACKTHQGRKSSQILV